MQRFCWSCLVPFIVALFLPSNRASPVPSLVVTTTSPDETENMSFVNVTGPHKTVCNSSEMLDHTTASPPRLLILALVAFLIIVKTLAKVFKSSTKYVPESAWFVIFGIVSGFVLGIKYQIVFDPHLFFDFLLPMIVLDAAYFVSNRDLLRNLSKILIFAVIGTFINLVLIGSGLEFFKSHYGFEISLMHLLVFSTILSAVDPVAVICVFEDIKVNDQLYINVFGESLLNDGVSVVFYRLFARFVEEKRELSVDMAWIAAYDFLKSAIIGSLIGFSGSLCTSLFTKFTHRKTSVQPIYVIFVPFSAYIISESIHVSGIIAIMIAAIFMKPYTNVNLTYESKNLVNFVMKSISSCSESYIFMFLGISAHQVLPEIDIPFCIVTVGMCITARVISVFGLSLIINLTHKKRICWVNQFVMAYSGLRGAVCFGLVMSLDTHLFPCKQYFASGSFIVILFTIFAQGMTVKWIVKFINVKLSDEAELTRLEVTGNEVAMKVSEGMQAIAGRSWLNTITHRVRYFHDTFITKLLWVRADSGVPNRSAVRIIIRHEEIETHEAFENFKKFGSFAALPVQPDNDDIGMRKSKSMCNPMSCAACGPRIPDPLIEEAEPPLTFTNRTLHLPRNISDRRLLTAIFEDDQYQTNLYSRHFTEDEPEHPTIFQIFGGYDQSSPTYNTLPNPGGPRKTARRRSTDKGVTASAASAAEKAATPASLMPSRPLFTMGGDEKTDEVPLATFKTGRFQVAKQSPSPSTVDESALLLEKVDETKKHS